MFHKKQLVIHAYDLDTTDTTLLECCFLHHSVCVLFIPDCHMNITIYFFYNSGWVQFILDGDLVITVYFFTTLDGCWLFPIVNWSSLFVCFFTTLDGCCLFLIVICPLLFIFLQLWMHAVCF